MKKLLASLMAFTMVALAGCSSGGAAEGKYPSKNLEFIVPYSAGGGTDSLMRLLTAGIEKDWGKSLVVSNKAGNLGQVGLTELSKKPADGYTLGALSNLDHVLVLLTGENLEYDYDSFEYIGAINTTSNVLMASKESGFKTLDELITYGKENPGKVTVAVSGKTHIAEAALIEKATGLKMTTIMQGSGGESVNAVLGGHVDVAILDKNFVSQVEGHDCPTLAVLSEERLPVIPDVPTMKEQGYDVATETYRVIVAPKGTPEDILNTISDTIKRVSETEDFQSKMTNMNEIYRFLSSEQVKERLDQDMKTMTELVKESPDIFAK